MYIPSPAVNGFYIGPAFIHVYGLMYVVGITLAILITQRRWKAIGGDPGLVGDVAIWAVPAGIIGGRIYFDLTTPKYIPHHWYGVFAAPYQPSTMTTRPRGSRIAPAQKSTICSSW